jgi:hypothetical protein
VNGYFLLDFDSIDYYHQFFPNNVALEATTMVVRSPHGGVHVWLKSSETPRRQIRSAEELDLLGVGGYAVGPGSTIDHALCDRDNARCPHTGTARYEIANSYRIMDAEVLSPWASIADMIREKAQTLGWQVRKDRAPVKEIAIGVTVGSRNDSAFAMAKYVLHVLNMAPADALFALRIWNARNKPPLDERELEQVLRSASNYPRGHQSGSTRIVGGLR